MSPDYPFFSVILPVYNREGIVACAIESVLSQTYRSYELIVVDDGSTDRTPEVLRRYSDCCVIIRRHNSGVSSSRNVGIQSARGDYVAFIDSDDVWLPWSLDVYRQLICSHSRPSFVSARVQPFEGEVPSVPSGLFSVCAEYSSSYFKCNPRRVGLVPSASVVRRDVLLSVGGFTVHSNPTERTAEDADLFLKLGEAPGFVYCTAPVQCFYRCHIGNHMGKSTKSLKGLSLIVSRYHSGLYADASWLRLCSADLITRYTRSNSILSLRQRQFKESLRLYLATFRMNLICLRILYLIAYPVLLVRCFLLGK